MSFNRLLADSEPAKAAQAALVMARATVAEPDVSEETRRIAQQFIELGVDELTELIRRTRAAARRCRPARGMCIGLPALNRHHVSVVEDLLGIDRTASSSATDNFRPVSLLWPRASGV